MMPLNQRLAISKNKRKPVRSTPVMQPARSLGQKVVQLEKGPLVINKGSMAKRPPKTKGGKMPLKPDMKMAQKAGKGYKGC